MLALGAIACGGSAPAPAIATAEAPADARAPAVVELAPTATPSDAEAARAAALEQARSAGILGVFGRDSDAGVFMRGGDLGGSNDALGGLTGDSIGDAFGAGGLGLSGIGPSAGGTGEGTIGLGSIGTIGHGAGTGSSQGFGSGSGRLGGARKNAPNIRTGAATVVGTLPPEVIRRIVRQNLGRMRFCYETALVRSPKLAGRVTVKFVIDRSGAVASAVVESKDLPDEAVASCVTKTFLTLQFPQPEGNGVVVVSYPVSFSPADGSASPAASPATPKVASVNGRPLGEVAAADVEAALKKAGWQLESTARRNGPNGAGSIVDFVVKKNGVTATITFQPAKHADAAISPDERSRLEAIGSAHTEGDFYLGVVIVGDQGAAQSLVLALVDA
jgi:hypothetical protein